MMIRFPLPTREACLSVSISCECKSTVFAALHSRKEVTTSAIAATAADCRHPSRTAKNFETCLGPKLEVGKMIDAKSNIASALLLSENASPGTSWVNYARSCFASRPTVAIPQNDYVHWSDEPTHKLMLRLPHVVVGGGALPPYSATAFHSHHHNTFVLSILDTPTLLLQNMQPADYLHRQAHRLLSVTSGACFSQCPLSSKLPLVHRATTLHHPVAFIILESSIPPLLTCAPSFTIDENSSAKPYIPPSTNFWAAVQLHLDPDALVSFKSRPPSCPLPVGRFICCIQSSLEGLKVKLPTHLTRKTVETDIAGTPLQIMTISGFNDSSDTCLRIRNATDADWRGVVVDIFGTTSS